MSFFQKLLAFNNNIARKFNIEIFVIVPDFEEQHIEKNILIQRYLPALDSVFLSHFPNINISLFLVSLDNLILQNNCITGVNGGVCLVKSKFYQDYYQKMKLEDIWDTKEITQDIIITPRSFIFMMCDDVPIDKKIELHNILGITRSTGRIIFGSIPYPQYMIPPKLYGSSVPAFYGTIKERATDFFKKYKSVELSVPYNHHKNEVFEYHLETGKGRVLSIEKMQNKFSELSHSTDHKTVSIRKLQEGEKIRFFSFGGKLIPVFQRLSDKNFFICENEALNFITKYALALEEVVPSFSRIYDVLVFITQDEKIKFQVQEIQNEYFPDIIELDDFMRENINHIKKFLNSLSVKQRKLICEYPMDGILYQAIYKVLGER